MSPRAPRWWWNPLPGAGFYCGRRPFFRSRCTPRNDWRSSPKRISWSRANGNEFRRPFVQRPGRDIRVFLDANVIFSAAYSPEGWSAALFLFARRKRCRLISSRFALEEASRNLEQQRAPALKVFAKNLPWIRVVPEADASAIERV